MGLSLRDLAERCGVSAPMLSQVERGETSPTLAVATRIAVRAGAPLSQLLRLDEGEGVSAWSAPATAARAAPRAQGHSYEVLTPPLPGQRAEVSLHTLAPERPPAAPATRRCTSPAAARPRWCTTGAVRLVCEGAAYDLDEGDSVTFDADLPHHFENPGRRARRALMAVVSRRPQEELTCRKTLFDKIWEAHEVRPGLLYIDLHLVHEVTCPQAFEGLRLAGRAVRRPDRTLATADHNVPTDGSTTAAQIRDHLSPRAGRDARAELRASSASRSTRSAPTTRASCT